MLQLHLHQHLQVVAAKDANNTKHCSDLQQIYLKCTLQAFRDLVGRQYRLSNHLDVVPELPTFNDYVAVGNGTGLWATNGSVYLQERPVMPINQLTWDDHACALYEGNLIFAPAASIPANVVALNSSSGTAQAGR